MVLQDKKVTHNVKLYATRESRASTRESALYFGRGEARRDPLQSAMGDTLQEDGGVADLSEFIPEGRQVEEEGEKRR